MPLDTETAAIPAAPSVVPLVYTIDDLCIVLKVNRTTIYDLHHEGTITIRKVGGRSVVLKSEIDEMLAGSIMPRNPNATRKAKLKEAAAKKAAQSAELQNGAPTNGAANSAA